MKYLYVGLFVLAACNHQTGANGDGDGGNGSGNHNGKADMKCTGLACQIDHDCTGGTAPTTTLKGTVYAPNGTLPLYNATVFVPGGTVADFDEVLSCDRCDGTVSGEPIAIQQTGPDGKFILENVPSGDNIPLVIQLGRWRRQVTIPHIESCAPNELTDIELLRLPKDKSEGHIPKMAIATGDADPFECLLLKLGLSASEVTAPSGTGRVHFYRGTDKPGLDLQNTAPRASELYGKLESYDVVLLPCEGKEFNKGKLDGNTLSPDPRASLASYVDKGGRVFATHYSYDWLTYKNSPFNKVATPLDNGRWPVGQADDYDHTIIAQLVTSFPKGMDFAKWLGFAGAKSTPNTLNIDEGRHDVTGVDPKYAQSWATYDFTPVGSGPGVMHFTFNTPLDPTLDAEMKPQYCGRVVFSDFHVTAGALVDADKPGPFPSACKSGEMTDQEKALVFMLFDLSSCVQEDSQPPIP